jgi:hypothetical protein
MSSALMVELRENLKALNLAATARGLETSIRQAKESGPGYDEFLLDLTITELASQSGTETHPPSARGEVSFAQDPGRV